MLQQDREFAERRLRGGLPAVGQQVVDLAGGMSADAHENESADIPRR